MDLSFRDLDWRRLLIKHYKNYGLDEKDLAVVFCLEDIISSVRALVTADDLISYMTLGKDEIDKSLVKLLDMKLIAYVSEGGKTYTTLKPLLSKIVADLKKDIVIESNETAQKQTKDLSSSLYSYFEDTLGRTLTGREADRISFWIRSGADEKMIKEAVERLRAQNKAISFAAVDRIILAMQKSDDISQEGFSSRKENWRKGSQETLDILSKRWVPKE